MEPDRQQVIDSKPSLDAGAPNDGLPLHPRPVREISLHESDSLPAYEAETKSVSAAMYQACWQLQSLGCAGSGPVGTEGTGSCARLEGSAQTATDIAKAFIFVYRLGIWNFYLALNSTVPS